jgi:hypothetical protein
MVISCHLRVGDPVRLKSHVTETVLTQECGIFHSHDFLLGSQPKIVHELAASERGTLVYLKPRSEHILWVFDTMLEKVEAP